MRGWVGLIGVFVPFLALLAASVGPFKGRRLWGASLFFHLVSWVCFVFLTASFYAGHHLPTDTIASSLFIQAEPWALELGLRWDFQTVIFSLAATSVLVCFHFLARKTLENSRASIAGLGSYLGCLLGALGAGHLLLFSIFFAGSLLPRFVFTGVDGRQKGMNSISESAFLGIVALFSLLVVVLVFSSPFKDGLGEWFQFSNSSYEVRPGAIGFSLLVLAAAVGAGIFPFHGNARKIYQLDEIERAVPLALQPLLGFAVLFHFSGLLFSSELKLFSPYLAGLFSVALAYCAVNFMGTKSARGRIFWLQQAMSSLVAIGFFSLSQKGWHGALVLLFFQSLAVPFFLAVLSCHERRQSLPVHRITEYPVLGLSTAFAVLFSLLLPVSIGFYGVLLVIWSMGTGPSWYLPFVIVSMPLIALAGMNSMFFQLGEQETAGAAVGDLTYEEMLAILPIGAVLLILGIMPRILMGPLGASVAALFHGLGMGN